MHVSLINFQALHLKSEKNNKNFHDYETFNGVRIDSFMAFNIENKEVVFATMKGH
jgi:hypothetical protein